MQNGSTVQGINRSIFTGWRIHLEERNVHEIHTIYFLKSAMIIEIQSS